MANLSATKSIDTLMQEAQDTSEHSLKRTLGPVNLIMLGIGAVIGAGLFVRTAAAIADRSGPSVTLAFIVAGIGCAFAGLCYAEFASMIPVAGSAYTYSYATMGELVAWIIGWDLVLEYAVGAATVAIAWSEYFNRVLEWFNLRIPYQWSHSPFEVAHDTGVHGVVNIPAVFILLLLTMLLIRGTRESAYVNAIIVVVKVRNVLSGVATVEDFRSSGREASVAFAITKYMTGYEWLSKSVTVAILAGFSSVILVMLLGQSRVFYSMSHDGLVPKIFSEVHPRYRTPYKSNMLFFVFTSLFGAFIPEDIVGEMTSIGTLFAFILVCAGVWIMRRRRPDVPRGFTVPALPVVAVLGILTCAAMVFGLGWTNWMRLIVWLLIGLVIYFSYGRKHSKVQALNATPPAPKRAPSMAD